MEQKQETCYWHVRRNSTWPIWILFCFLSVAILLDTCLSHTDTQNGLMIKAVLMGHVSSWDSCSLCQKSLTRSHYQGGQSGLSRVGGHTTTPQRPQALHHVKSALPEGQTQLAHMCGRKTRPRNPSEPVQIGVYLKIVFWWQYLHKIKWSTQMFLSVN